MATRLQFDPSGYEAPVGTVDLTWAPPPPPPWEAPVGTADLVFGPSGYEAPVGTVALQFGQPTQDGDGSTTHPPATLSIQATMAPPRGDLRGHAASRGKLAINLPGLASARLDASFDINVDRAPKAATTSVWQQADDVAKDMRDGWEQSARRTPSIAMPWQQAADRPHGLRDGFENPPGQSQAATSRWQEGQRVDQGERNAWQYPGRADRQRRTRWEESQRVDQSEHSAWQYPGRLDQFEHPRWEVAGYLPPLAIRSDFGQGRWQTAGSGLPWENAQWPEPGFDPPPAPPGPPEPPPPWEPSADLVMCAPVPHAPWILAFGVDPCAGTGGGGEPGDGTILIPTRRIYIVQNSAHLVRVADGRDLPATAVTVSIDTDSWSWTLSASLASASALALVEGTDAEPVEVDAMINGHTWRVLIDGWQLQEAWKRGGGTIRGRSRAAYLASPYADARDYLEASDRTAQQLAAQELPTGWSLDWRLNDWLVPAGAWSYQGLAPIDVIARIAEAGGGYVQAHRNQDTVSVLPRYPSAPWEWGAAGGVIQVPRAVMLQRSSDKKPGDSRNAVYVHGQSPGGILAHVKRSGTAGDRLAETIVDPLITDPAPARARGIAALATTGRQATETHELPLSDDLGGLIEPGRMIEAGSDNGGGFQGDWRGLVRGLSVTANAKRASNGGVSLAVRQSLTIERHYQEA